MKEQRLNFLQSKSMDLPLYDENCRHERVKALLLACIHQDIFPDYETR